MIRRPPRSTRTDTLFPYPTLFRSASGTGVAGPGVPGQEKRGAVKLWGSGTPSARGPRVTVSPCFAGFLQARNLFLPARHLSGRLLRGFFRYLLLSGLGPVLLLRSEERRFGIDFISTCRPRCSLYLSITK